MKDLLQSVIDQLKPSSQNSDKVKEFIQILQKYTKEEVFIGGSFAKNTHIGITFDCDIFIRFSNKTDVSKQLEEIVKTIHEKEKLPFEIIHGSRDYYQVIYKEITFELIPVIQITETSEAENIMDYSPFHVTWVKKKLQEKPLENDIRLLKQFFKAQKVYGAESYIEGFSGHITDLLVIYYGGFEETIKAIAKWSTKKKTIIDPENHYKGKDALFYLNESKTQSPLIIIDPISKDRNAAAAVSNSCYEKIIKQSKEFMKNPSERFFQKEYLTKEILQKKYPKQTIIPIIIEPVKGKKDIVGTKLVKTLEIICKELEKNGFKDVSYDWDFEWKDTVTFFIISKDTEISNVYLQKGPETTMTKAYEEFLKEHSDEKIVEKDGRVFVEKKRKHTKIESAIKATFTNALILDKVSNIYLG